MSKHLVSLKAVVTIMDIVLEADDFDPNSEADVATALEHWLDNGRRVFEAVEEVEVLSHRCMDEQPCWNRFEDSEHPLEPAKMGSDSIEPGIRTGESDPIKEEDLDFI